MSTFLSVLVVAALLLGVGVLTGRIATPTLAGGSEVVIALPPLTDTTAPPASGPGSIPPGAPDGGNGNGNGNGGGTPGPGPGPGPDPRDQAPAVGADIGSDDVAGAGLIEAHLPPIRLGSSSGESTSTSVDLLGIEVELVTSDHLVEDVLCVLICQ